MGPQEERAAKLTPPNLTTLYFRGNSQEIRTPKQSKLPKGWLPLGRQARARARPHGQAGAGCHRSRRCFQAASPCETQLGWCFSAPAQGPRARVQTELPPLQNARPSWAAPKPKWGSRDSLKLPGGGDAQNSGFGDTDCWLRTAKLSAHRPVALILGLRSSTALSFGVRQGLRR